MARAGLSLGSNIEPEYHLRVACAALAEQFPGAVFSPIYRLAAVGFEGPAFLNAAALITTTMTAVELDAWLHQLEDAQGRDRSAPRFASRTLDVDLVLYDDAVIEGPGNLRVPRPELKHAFVLKPLAEIAPDWVVPGTGQTLAHRWAQHPEHAQPFDVVML